MKNSIVRLWEFYTCSFCYLYLGLLPLSLPSTVTKHPPISVHRRFSSLFRGVFMHSRSGWWRGESAKAETWLRWTVCREGGRFHERHRVRWLSVLGLVFHLIWNREWAACQTQKGSKSFCVCLSFLPFVSFYAAFKHLCWQEYLAGGGSVSNVHGDFSSHTEWTKDSKSSLSHPFFLYMSLSVFCLQLYFDSYDKQMHKDMCTIC